MYACVASGGLLGEIGPQNDTLFHCFLVFAAKIWKPF